MKLSNGNIEKARVLLSTMANPMRLGILKLLLKNELSVGQLVMMLNVRQPFVSQHLAKLRAQNLVIRRRDNQTLYYSSDTKAVRSVLKALDTIFGGTASSAASTSKAPRRRISA